MKKVIYLIKVSSIKSYSIRDNSDILKILLKDRTTRKSIIWATDSYHALGEGYQSKDHIKESLLKNESGQLIKPRLEKDDEEQSKRTRGKGEVFTPTWIIKKKVDLIEKELYQLDLEDYVGQRWLEITCGEGPYIVSRYDTVTGEYLDIEKRVGFLDRKLQRISKEIEDEKTWFYMVLKAYQSSYGYEYQGDSLLIARENLLNSFIDYYVAKFNNQPLFEKLKEIARVISYNIFQMNGLKYTIPMPEKIRTKKLDVQLNFLGDIEMKDQQLEMVVEEGEEVKVKNWLNDRMIKFKDLVESEGRVGSLKFDVVIGNPPYQDKNPGKNNQAPPIYNFFIDQTRKISDKSILITPARFLANTGATPKKWNEKMLKDKHVKVLYFNPNSSDVFPNTDIKGGVVVTYHDFTTEFEKIEIFIPYKELDSIYKKTKQIGVDNGSIGDWVYSPDSYRLSDLLFQEKSKLKERTDKSHRKAVSSNVFERYEEIFLDENIRIDDTYIQIYGRYKGERVYRYIKRKYVDRHPNLDKWKIFIPGANGSGELGEILSTPIIGPPKVGHNQTFISIGALNSKSEAKSLLKYIKTKFARVMLGIMKTTQNNQSKRTWSKVPLQDFTPDSDIDWTKSIAEIDKQLYKKYGLDEEEINFIESNVKEME